MPTIAMSAKKEQAQLSTYARKLRDNVKTILDNYGEILKVAQVRLPIVCSVFQFYTEYCIAGIR